jgi:hypothetical protein
MKKLAIMLLVAMLCVGCSNNELDSVQAELSDITAKYEQLQKDYDTLQTDYEELKEELDKTVKAGEATQSSVETQAKKAQEANTLVTDESAESELTPEFDLNPPMAEFEPEYQSIYVGEPIVVSAQAGDNTQIDLGTTLVLPYAEVTVAECGMAEEIPIAEEGCISCHTAGDSATQSYLRLEIKNTTNEAIYPDNRVWVNAEYDDAGGLEGYGSLVAASRLGDNPLAIQPQETKTWYAACHCSFERRDKLNTCVITIGFPSDIHGAEGVSEGSSAYTYNLSFKPE